MALFKNKENILIKLFSGKTTTVLKSTMPGIHAIDCDILL